MAKKAASKAAAATTIEATSSDNAMLERLAQQLVNIPEIAKVQFTAPEAYDSIPTSHYGYFYRDRDGVSRCLDNFTSKVNYNMTTREDYLALMQSAITAMGVIDAEVKATWLHSKSAAGATIIVSPSRDEQKEKYSVDGGDYVFPRIVIRAPFGSVFSFNAGFYRHACSNLDLPRLAGEGLSVQIRHSNQLRDRIDDLVETCSKVTDFESMIAACRDYNTRELNYVNALHDIYPSPQQPSATAGRSELNQFTRWQNRIELIKRRIEREQRALHSYRSENHCTLFQLVQAITGYVQHDKTRRGNVSLTDRHVRAFDDAETIAAWDYARAIAS